MARGGYWSRNFPALVLWGILVGLILIAKRAQARMGGA